MTSRASAQTPGDVAQSLQALDGQDWGEPIGDTRLERECKRLRRVPLRELSPEDLRMLLGQRIGQEYLRPVALARLEADPLIAGDYYPGDLLLVTLAAPPGVWQRHPDWRSRANAVARRALALLDADSTVVEESVAGFLRENVGQFLRDVEGE